MKLIDPSKFYASSFYSTTDLGLVQEYKKYDQSGQVTMHWVRGYECPWPLPFPIQEVLF